MPQNERSEERDLYRHVGQRIKQRRKALDISQTQIAERMNLSYQQIQKYENGLCQILLGRLLQFAQILNVTPDYFYQGVNSDKIGRRIEDDLIHKARAQPVHILFVGQDTRDAALFQTAFEPFRDKACLETVKTPEAALKHMRDADLPDMIVIDTAFHQAGDFDMIRNLKKNSQTAGIPVIVMTHDPRRQPMLESYRLGIAGFMLKSADAQEFRESLRGFLHYWTKTVVLP